MILLLIFSSPLNRWLLIRMRTRTGACVCAIPLALNMLRIALWWYLRALVGKAP